MRKSPFRCRTVNRYKIYLKFSVRCACFRGHSRFPHCMHKDANSYVFKFHKLCLKWNV